MSDTTRRSVEEDGFAELHADVLTEELLDPDLLLRFGRDPDTLTREERQRVESYLAVSPSRRDELALLLRFAAPRAGGGEREDLKSADTVVPISSHARWRRLQRGIGLALAAGVALALVLGMPDAEDDALEVAEQLTLPPAPELTLPAPPDEERLAPPIEPTSSPDSAKLALEPEPRPSTEPAAATESTTVAASKTRTPIEHSPPEQIQPAAPEPDPRPTVIAMSIVGPIAYVAPEDAPFMERLGVLRDGGGSSAELTTLQALVPDHIARTASPSPTLYWYLSPAVDQPLEFVLADQVSIDPALELTLPPPHRAGIHALRLADHGVELVPGRRYDWFVSITADQLTRGSVTRVMPGAELAARIEASSAGARGRAYAEAGLWYDALAFISEAIAQSPSDDRLRALREELLRNAGHSDVAHFDREATTAIDAR